MRAPWPISVLAIGDSYTSYGAGTVSDWGDIFPTVWPSITFVNEATGSKCLADSTGPLGADTVFNSIDADLAANPNADVVVWATSAINDILRRKQILNTITFAALQTAALFVLNQIQASGKGLIVMGVPWQQALISGAGDGDDASSIAAYDIRNQFNDYLKAECAKRKNFVFYSISYMWIDLGPLVIPGNGFQAPYFLEGLHPSTEGAKAICQDVMGMLKQMNVRKRAA